MKKLIPILCVGGLLAAGPGQFAAHAGPSGHGTHHGVGPVTHSISQGALFRSQELNFSIFGAVTVSDLPALDSSWGGGVELSYFASPYLGFGIEGLLIDSSEDRPGAVDLTGTLGAVNGSIILRAPMDDMRLAPYLFGGGGWLFNGTDSFQLHAGGGIEYRITDNVGLFSDARFVWLDEFSDNYGLFRAGLRFSF